MMKSLNRLLSSVILPLAAILTFSSSQGTTGTSAGRICNGRSELCDLRFDQVTFPGSHSAGSGFSGVPRECDGDEANSCVFSTQSQNIFSQLEQGVRFLSLDICILPPTCDESTHIGLDSSRLVSCRGSDTDTRFNGYAYGGSLIEILRQVDEWMRINTNEVIGIHFTRNIPPSNRSQVFNSLIPILEGKWGQNGTGESSTRMSTYYKNNMNTWPTLRQAISDDQRIFIFVDQELNIENTTKDWKNPTPYLNFEPTVFDRSCASSGNGIEDHAQRCEGTGNRELVIAAGYTLALCINNGQESCNNLLQSASDICYDFREKDNRTLNVILVDFPDDTVIGVADMLNDRNIMRFFVPPPPTTTEDSFFTSGSGDGETTPPDTTSSANGVLRTSNTSSLALTVSLFLLVAIFSPLHSSL